MYYRFNLDDTSGVLTVIQPLDYETKTVYHLSVVARDSAPDARSTTATVTVSVIDIQDNVPIFVSTLYEATVPENAAGFKVADVIVGGLYLYVS